MAKNKNQKFNKQGKKDSKKGNYSGNSSCNSNDTRDGASSKYSTQDRQERRGTYDNIHSNDITWYNKSVIYADSTRIPFNRIPGSTFKVADLLPETLSGSLKPQYQQMAVEGVARLEYVPTIGISHDANSAVNRCFTSIYGDIYSKTTGAMQFQQADLALLSLGMASILNTVAQIKRVLGLPLLFPGNNYYFPKAIVSACGVDFDTVSGRQDHIRMKLNEYISNINGLKMPAFIDLFKRSYQLGLNIYADEDDIMAQYYAFVPEGYYVYRDTGAEGISEVSCLEYKEFIREGAARTCSVDYLLEVLNEQLESWRQSSDLGLISGSIQRAYAEKDLIFVEHCPVDYTTIPQYDRNMLWQINNATLCKGVRADSMHVTQIPNKNILLSEPEMNPAASETNVFYGSAPLKLLNSYDNNTSDEFIMEGTRLVIHTEVPTNSDPEHAPITICGSEIVTDFYVYQWIKTDDDPELKLLGWSQLGVANATTVEDLADMCATFSAVTRFKHAPRLWLGAERDGDCEINPFGFGDLYRWTTIDAEALSGLMLAATQSIYVVNVRTDIQ